MNPKVFIAGEDGFEEPSDADNEKVKAAVEATMTMIDKLTAEKGAEHAGYVILLYNVMTFNKMLTHQDRQKEAEMLSDLIGGWVGKMVVETMCKDDQELAARKLHEMAMDCQAMDFLVNSDKITATEKGQMQ